MKKNYFSILYLVLLMTSSIAFFSCEKDEGFGGNSSIKGTVMLHQYNDDFSLLINEQPAKEIEVFIIFGNDPDIGDRIRTNYDGYFEFRFLREGNYTIYYYSEDKDHPEYEQKVEKLTQISVGKNSTADLGELIMEERLDFDDGNAVIKGRVLQINYKSNSRWPLMFVEDTVMALEKEVYLTYHNNSYFNERIRTNDDGTFEFRGLIKGNYKIHVISEDIKGTSQDVAMIRDTVITEPADTIDLGDIFIDNL